jgi:AcrR family transcriptional regulator
MSRNSNTRISKVQPLPRGRHGLDFKDLRALRRTRLLQAMMELVAHKGYAQTTVPEVVAAARVSRNAFYEFFDDKEDCFLALCDEYALDLHKILVGFVSGGTWQSALRNGLRAYLTWWRERPQFSRACFLELSTVGERAIAQRQRAYAPFETMFAQLGGWIRRVDPGLPPLPGRVPRMLVIAITETIADEVRAGRTNELLDLEDDLLFLILRLLGSGESPAAVKPIS